MLNHLTLFVSDLKVSKEFYSRALEPLGYKLLVEKRYSAGFGIEDAEGKRDFWIKLGNKKESPSLSCLGFTATSKAMVDNFYRAAFEAGGKDNGAPEYCKEYYPGYYAAFVLDPDGYNIEAVFDDPSVK